MEIKKIVLIYLISKMFKTVKICEYNWDFDNSWYIYLYKQIGDHLITHTYHIIQCHQLFKT